jgi:hypothetical protein
MSIEQIFINNGTDKARYKNAEGNMSGHAYANLYELIDAYIKMLYCVQEFTHIMEIGYETGAGIAAFKQIFPFSMFVSVDIDYSNDRFPQFVKPRFEKISCDCSNRDHIKGLMSYLADIKFGLIVDDASHVLEHQKLCLEELWPLLEEGGLYIIEDIYTIEQANEFRNWPGFTLVDTRAIGAANDICVILRKEVKNALPGI